MSKVSRLQRIECFQQWLEQFKKNRKYQKPKTTMADLVEIKTKYARKDEK